MLMKNTIIGIICFLIVAGTSLRFTDGSEGKETAQPKETVQQSESVEPEKEYKLIEEIKVYLTSPKETFAYIIAVRVMERRLMGRVFILQSTLNRVQEI